MNTNVIKSYLVELSFAVDNPAQRKFDEVLRLATQGVSKFAGTMATDMAVAGAGVVSALTAIATGAAALAVNTANSDLQMQLMARRMFMSLPAFREMRLALDALGVSAQDVIWGPPELRERYKMLVEDSRRIMTGMGMADFERQMRMIRDVEFQFTRMRQEAQLFVMALVKSLSKALTGDEFGILGKLKEWNEWLIKNIPDLADKFSSYLAPILKDVYGIWRDTVDILKTVSPSFKSVGAAIMDITHSIKTMFDWLDKLAHWLAEHREVLVVLGALRGGMGGAALGTAFGPWGTIIGGAGGAIAGGYATSEALKYFGSGTSSAAAGGGASPDVKAAIIAAAQRYGVDPALALAIAQKESGMNPNAPRGSSGEYGMMQVMPGTFARYGSGDPNDFMNNLNASMAYLSDLSGRFGGNEYAMARAYNGMGPAAEAYAQDVMKREQALAGTVNINIYAQTSDPAQHARMVVEEMQRLRSQRQQVQASPVYVVPAG